jgi:hypothetical protein
VCQLSNSPAGPSIDYSGKSSPDALLQAATQTKEGRSVWVAIIDIPAASFCKIWRKASAYRIESMHSTTLRENTSPPL